MYYFFGTNFSIRFWSWVYVIRREGRGVWSALFCEQIVEGRGVCKKCFTTNPTYPTRQKTATLSISIQLVEFVARHTATVLLSTFSQSGQRNTPKSSTYSFFRPHEEHKTTGSFRNDASIEMLHNTSQGLVEFEGALPRTVCSSFPKTRSSFFFYTSGRVFTQCLATGCSMAGCVGPLII